MTTTEIYNYYQQTKMLQIHQLRVAAVAKLIVTARADADFDVVKALTVHDLGNMVRLDFNKFPEDCEPEGVAYWLNVQAKIIKEFGEIDHDATTKMLAAIAVPQKIIAMAEAVNWELIEKAVASPDINLKILNYADMRVGPFGVLPAVQRIDEVNKRKKSWPEYELIRAKVLELESQIFSGIDLKPEAINDAALVETIEQLKQLELFYLSINSHCFHKSVVNIE